MYRIMDVKTRKDNYETTYAFKTNTVDGVLCPVEFSTEMQLDAYVEDLLNNKGYAKDDFIIVEVKDFSVAANIV